MDFYNAFKSFFGLPNSVPPGDFRRYDEYYPDNYEPNGRQPPIYNEEEPPWQEAMQMHEIIEQQMQHIMRAFGFDIGNSESIFGDFFNSVPHENYLQIEPPGSENSSLREHYLKPGFDHPETKKADTDVDDNVDLEDLDTLMKSKTEAEQPMTPYKHPRKKHSFFFGQSMSTKTIVKPDGTVETTKTVQDNEGNKETTVTHKNKDSEYTIITRVDKNGEETKEEKFVNLSGNPGAPIPQLDAPGVESGSRSWRDFFWKRP